MTERILTNPVTGEKGTMTEVAKQVGINLPSMCCRVKKYGYKHERLFYPKSHSRVIWTEAETNLIKETWLLPNSVEVYKKEAKKNGYPNRSSKSIKQRIFLLRQQGEILLRKGSLELAMQAGALNETQLAECLGVSSQTVQTFWRDNGLRYTICKQTHYRFIELKHFASWGISAKGAPTLAKAISQDRRAIAWVLEVIGKWLWT
jgi:hypothetical protein